MSRPMTVYLAGPMTGIKDHNYPAFHAAARELRLAGYDVVSPAECDTSENLAWEDWMRLSLKAMLTCTHVALLPDWHKSTGARMEQDLAAKLRMKCASVENFLKKEI